MKASSRRVCVFGMIVAAAVGITVSGPISFAQMGANGGGVNGAQANSNDPEQLMDDFVHYVLIARPDLADGAARALLESGISDADLYRLLIDEIDEERFDNALLRAMRIDSLADTAAELEMHLRRGRLDLARDPDEIARNIELLLGSARARQMAREALMTAGEYAVPQLLDVLVKPGNQGLKTEARLMLARMRSQAVTPLCVALPHVDQISKERICIILGEIGWRHALPWLYDTANDSANTEAVITAAQNAYDRIGGPRATNSTQLWLELGEQYWDEAESLFAWPGEETANVWDYETQLGLYATPVPTDIFSEVMAMRTAKKALAADMESLESASLWIASNFRRQDQLPSGEVDPTYGADMRPPLFYAVLAGPNAAQRVLQRANEDLNTKLARHAIEALSTTAGGASLWIGGGGSTPLVQSLNFPERRVRYDAALALARALPATSFDGSDRVVPILAGAIRTGNETFAAVISNDEEDQRALAANVRNMGFTVLPPRSDYSGLAADILDSPGVDLFVIKTPMLDINATINAIQSDPRVAATPILVLVPGETLNEVEDMVGENRRVRVARTGLREAQLRNTVMALIEANLGPLMTAEEANEYARKSLLALRDIAVSGTSAFNVANAGPALADALDDYQDNDELRLAAAETLSWVGTGDAQQTLFNASLNESDTLMQVALLEYLSDSARRFGSFATPRQVNRLIDLVRNASGPAATAAAQAHGALDLPSSNVAEFIVVDEN